jgi:hypothetical protein
MKIAFLTIATNKYVNYAHNLIKSLEAYAFKDTNNEVSLIVCTDQDIEFDNKKRVRGISTYITHVPFPIISLLRYHYYSDISDSLRHFDYVYHIDCDMQMNETVSEEILSKRVCVQHPGVNRSFSPANQFPYDKNPQSNAFIDDYSGYDYYQNCFQGGETEEFITMCISLRNKIEEDLRKNYIALWHDESYMNRYMNDNRPTLVLPSIYAYPQNWNLGPVKKIIHLDKNHLEMRKTQ